MRRFAQRTRSNCGKTRKERIRLLTSACTQCLDLRVAHRPAQNQNIVNVPAELLVESEAIAMAEGHRHGLGSVQEVQTRVNVITLVPSRKVKPLATI